MEYRGDYLKIGIIADTHENLPMIAKAVERFNKENVEIVFHAGDIIAGFTVKEFKNLKAKLYLVFGNNDGDRFFLRSRFKEVGEFYETRYETELEIQNSKFKILMIHQPDFLEQLIASQRYDVIIYGHTHQVDVREEGKTLIINPGECGGWLTGKPTCAILTLPERKIEICNL